MLAGQMLDAQARFMSDLEAAGRLNRKVEGLPSAAALNDLVAAGRGLSRPRACAPGWAWRAARRCW